MENSNVFPVFDFVLKQIFERLLFISTQETAYDTCVCDKKQVVLSGGMAARLVQEENSSSRPASSDTFFRKRSMEMAELFPSAMDSGTDPCSLRIASPPAKTESFQKRVRG